MLLSAVSKAAAFSPSENMQYKLFFLPILWEKNRTFVIVWLTYLLAPKFLLSLVLHNQTCYYCPPVQCSIRHFETHSSQEMCSAVCLSLFALEIIMMLVKDCLFLKKFSLIKPIENRSKSNSTKPIILRCNGFQPLVHMSRPGSRVTRFSQ